MVSSGSTRAAGGFLRRRFSPFLFRDLRTTQRYIPFRRNRLSCKIDLSPLFYVVVFFLLGSIGGRNGFPNTLEYIPTRRHYKQFRNLSRSAIKFNYGALRRVTTRVMVLPRRAYFTKNIPGRLRSAALHRRVRALEIPDRIESYCTCNTPFSGCYIARFAPLFPSDSPPPTSTKSIASDPMSARWTQCGARSGSANL